MNRTQAKKLSPSWVEAIDPKTERTYYANMVTKEVTWVKPEAEIKAELKQQASRKTKKKEKEDVWLERQDAKTGKIYYFNPAKRETSWHRPDNTISSGALQAEEGKGAWVERIDPRTGRPYYYNKVLGKTSWTNPDLEFDAQLTTNNKKSLKTETALKRLSMGLSDATKRLSQSISRLSFGGSQNNLGGNNNPIRNSARFSLATPIIPINKTEGRQSLRLGASINFNLVNDYNEAVKQQNEHSDEDKFAKLRAMKNQGQMPTQKKSENIDYEQKLKLDLNRECESVSWESVELKHFSQYSAENFGTRKKGGLFSSGNIDLNAISKCQRKPLAQPLHALSDKNLIADALYAFKTLLQFCGDKATKKEPVYHAKLWLSYGVATAEDLQCEMYAQLIKQSTNNSIETSEERVWELFALTCGVFVPPSKILPFVESHLKLAAETPPSLSIKKWAEYAFLRLNKCKEHNQVARLEVPSEEEVETTRQFKPYNIKLNLVSSTSINMQVDSWTTVRDVRDALEFRFQIKDGTPFALFEVTDEDNERVLEDNDRILDLVAYWQREKEQRRTKKYEPEFNFVYKIRLFFDISEEDTAAIELSYLQAVYEVLDSRYPCNLEDVITLAAFEAQEKFGDFENHDVFGNQLGAYLPQKFYHETDEAELKQKIYSIYRTFKGYDKLTCMINYLNYVKNWKFYGSAYYFAEPITLKLLGKEFPKSVIIGINAKGVLIIDPPTLDLIAEYPFSELVTWGYSNSNFVFVVGNLVRSTKLFFKTKDGVEMNGLIHAYVNKLMEAQPEGGGQFGFMPDEAEEEDGLMY